MTDIPRRGSFQPPTPFGPVVKVEKVKKSYGRLKALDSVDLEVRRGEIFGLIGPNGAGKSTLMRALVGSVELDSGTVRVMGLNPLSEKLRIKSYAGYVPESEIPPSFLTVSEFLEFVLHARGMEKDERTIASWISFFDLDGQQDTIARNLSKGTRQKLMLASAFVHEPPLLLLDEPFINLDPIYQRKVKDHLVRYSRDGGTAMICTHILALAEELCDRVCIIHKGKVLQTSPVKELKGDHGSLEDAFLRMVGFYSK